MHPWGCGGCGRQDWNGIGCELGQWAGTLTMNVLRTHVYNDGGERKLALLRITGHCEFVNEQVPLISLQTPCKRLFLLCSTLLLRLSLVMCYMLRDCDCLL